MTDNPIEMEKIERWKCKHSNYDLPCKHLSGGFGRGDLYYCLHSKAEVDEYGGTYIIGMDKCPKEDDAKEFTHECLIRGLDNCAENSCAITGGICEENNCKFSINNLYQENKYLRDKNKKYRETIDMLINDSCDRCGRDHCRIEYNSICSVAQIYREVIKDE